MSGKRSLDLLSGEFWRYPDSSAPSAILGGDWLVRIVNAGICEWHQNGPPPLARVANDEMLALSKV